VLWLILAPDQRPTTHSSRATPFSFGSFHQVSLAWSTSTRSATTSTGAGSPNTLYYALSATAITLAVSVPAGYGLAIGKFPGRKLVLLADAHL
jgi:multiple sugar transport system permease protein